jgi:hypothetical protein
VVRNFRLPPQIKAEPYRPLAEQRQLGLADAAIGIAIALITAGYAAMVHTSMDPRFLSAPVGNDVWFEGDLPAVADNVLHRWSPQWRNARHPLFPLLATAPTYVLRAAGLTDAQCLLVFTTLGAAAWSAVVFMLMRAATRSRAEAVVFTLLAAVTAGALFWLPSVETYTLGSVTLLVPLAVTAWNRSRAGEGLFVVTSALSLAVTTTNWMSGIAAAFSRRRPARALQITVNAFAIVIALWSGQHLLFRQVPFFVGEADASRFLFTELAGGLQATARAVVFHSVVMPAIEVIPEPKWGLRMTVQHAAVGSAGAVGAAASLLWAVLLAIGVYGMWKARGWSPLAVALAWTTVGQCVLYLCYGEETFLYALHVAPLLVACAAYSASVGRRWAIAIAAILVVLLAYNNLAALGSALQFFVISAPAGTVLR